MKDHCEMNDNFKVTIIHRLNTYNINKVNNL